MNSLLNKLLLIVMAGFFVLTPLYAETRQSYYLELFKSWGAKIEPIQGADGGNDVYLGLTSELEERYQDFIARINSTNKKFVIFIVCDSYISLSDDMYCRSTGINAKSNVIFLDKDVKLISFSGPRYTVVFIPEHLLYVPESRKIIQGYISGLAPELEASIYGIDSDEKIKADIFSFLSSLGDSSLLISLMTLLAIVLSLELLKKAVFQLFLLKNKQRFLDIFLLWYERFYLVFSLITLPISLLGSFLIYVRTHRYLTLYEQIVGTSKTLRPEGVFQTLMDGNTVLSLTSLLLYVCIVLGIFLIIMWVLRDVFIRSPKQPLSYRMLLKKLAWPVSLLPMFYLVLPLSVAKSLLIATSLFWILALVGYYHAIGRKKETMGRSNSVPFLFFILVTFTTVLLYNKNSEKKDAPLVRLSSGSYITLPYNVGLSSGLRYNDFKVNPSSDLWLNDLLILDPSYHRIENRGVKSFESSNDYIVLNTELKNAVSWLLNHEDVLAGKYLVNPTNYILVENIDYRPDTKYTLKIELDCATIDSAFGIRFQSFYVNQTGYVKDDGDLIFAPTCQPGFQSYTYSLPFDLNFIPDGKAIIYFYGLNFGTQVKSLTLYREYMEIPFVYLDIDPYDKVLVSKRTNSTDNLQVYNWRGKSIDFDKQDPLNVSAIINELLDKDILGDELTIWSYTNPYTTLHPLN